MTLTKRRSSSPIRFETERLIIRPHQPGDADRFCAWDRDPELTYFNDDDSDRFRPFTPEEAALYLEDIGRQDARRGIIHFAIEKKADGDFIGYCMVAEIERQHRRCKIGITIGERAEWGQGYAREALIPVIDYCFDTLKLNRIVAEIYCLNERSRRLFVGLGFRHEGTLRQSVWKRGVPLDDCLYGLLAEDWLLSRPSTRL